ncbi:LuxR C-terminal-related transcriptional regulator [Promicromonospora sp. NPDC090134]|uniref:LuxR C-terminal-related transcriptional regulator n=1 Tax=Promicromonospora sp. NPDC090134 TaxID=3364408 RepID=UPI0038230335
MRRENRRTQARDQLRGAYDRFTRMGAQAFADRARRELQATGEKAPRRPSPTDNGLTAQESRIAHLAGDGLTNRDIGAQLFLSPHTVEWHLRKVFTKTGVSSRRQLGAALRSGG